MATPLEQGLLSLVVNKGPEVVTAVIALVRDALEGAPRDTVIARAERVAALQGFAVSVEAKADDKRTELKTKARLAAEAVDLEGDVEAQLSRLNVDSLFAFAEMRGIKIAEPGMKKADIVDAILESMTA